MNPRIVLGLAVALAIPGAVGSALADVAPPDDYVENCTIEKQQAPGEICVFCRSEYASTVDCSDTYEYLGYAERCRTWGGSVYDVLFCKADPDAGTGGSAGSAGSGPTAETGGTPGSGGAPARKPRASGGGCSFAGRSASPDGLLLALVGLACGWRRRR